MFDNSKPYTFDRVIRIGITVVIIFVTLKLLGFLSDVLIPFFIAAILAYFIAPLTNFLHRKFKVRILAVIVSLLIVAIFLGGIGWLLIPMIIKEVNHIYNLLSVFLQDSNLADLIKNSLPDKLDQFVESIFSSERFQEYFTGDNLVPNIEKLSSRFLPGVWGVISGAAAVITAALGLIVILLYLIFILLDYEHISEGWKELLPEKYKALIIGFAEDFEIVMNRYFRNQALVASTVGFLFALGFWIIGLPMGILIGLFIGLLNMVPYLQIVGIIPCFFAITLYSLETGNSFWGMTGLVLLVLFIVQSFQDLVLVPFIMGRFTGFNPAIILLSITVWGKLLGMLGLIIALPLTYLLLTYYRRYILGIESKITKKGKPPKPISAN